jgi:GTP-binding protein
MSDHWENVTDNVEALLDMVLANVPALRFQKVLQMLITSLDFSAFRYRYWSSWKRCVERRYANLISKRDGTITKSRIKELHTFEGLGRKVQEVTAGDICAIVGVEGFEIDTIADYENQKL